MDETFYKELLNSLTDGVYFIDLQRKITFWNKAAERISGYSVQEIVGKSCGDNFLRHVDERGTPLCLDHCPLAATMTDGQARETQVYLHHKFGHRLPVFVRSTPMHNSLGEIIGAVEIFSDARKQVDIIKEMEELRHEVLTDQLTGIGNRRYASISLERMDNTLAESNVPYGVLFADIDHFKNINDTWGHHVGDKVLVMVAKTMKGFLRPLDIACRWGGEEFLILIPNTDEEGLVTAGERLRVLIEQSWINLNEELIHVTVSFGGAISQPDESSCSVIERADKQLYLSKSDGRNCTYINDKKVAP